MKNNMPSRISVGFFVIIGIFLICCCADDQVIEEDHSKFDVEIESRQSRKCTTTYQSMFKGIDYEKMKGALRDQLGIKGQFSGCIASEKGKFGSNALKNIIAQDLYYWPKDRPRDSTNIQLTSGYAHCYGSTALSSANACEVIVHDTCLLTAVATDRIITRDVSMAKASSSSSITAFDWSTIELGSLCRRGEAHNVATMVLIDPEAVGYLYDYSTAICYAGEVHLFNHSTAVLYGSCTAYIYGCNDIWVHQNAKVISGECNCKNVNIYPRDDHGIEIHGCLQSSSGTNVLLQLFRIPLMTATVFLLILCVIRVKSRSRRRHED